MKTLILLLFLSQNITIPSVTVPISNIKGDPFVHAVYFWLKDDISTTDRESFREILESLKKIKSVKKCYVLEPAGTNRNVVDNSYDFALIMHFKNAEAQENYQVDPKHTAAVEQMSDLIDRFVVYDAQ